MKKNKYEDMNEFATFGFLINALDRRTRDDGDRNASFPRSDAEDLSRGLSFIPGEVTLARRRGEKVYFQQPCDNPCCWYWQFPDGSRSYYWERHAFEPIEKEGKCLACGNTHIRGGLVKREEL